MWEGNLTVAILEEFVEAAAPIMARQRDGVERWRANRLEAVRAYGRTYLRAWRKRQPPTARARRTAYERAWRKTPAGRAYKARSRQAAKAKE